MAFGPRGALNDVQSGSQQDTVLYCRRDTNARTFRLYYKNPAASSVAPTL